MPAGNSRVLNQIYKSMGKFLLPLTLEQTYETIVKESIRLTKAKYAQILIRRGEAFELAYTSNQAEATITPRKRGFAYQAFKKRKIIVIDRSKILPYHQEMKKSDVKNVAFIPLSHGTQSIGLIVMTFTRKDPLTKEQLKLLNIVGSIASLAIRKMQYYNEIKAALETRDLFISLASHELKTPLTSIKIYTDLLKKNLPDSSESNKKILEKLAASTDRLTNLVDDFLQVEQIKKGKLEYYWNEQHLNQIMNQVTSEFQVLHPDHELSYVNNVGGQPDTIVADSDKLIQAIHNILNNAVKFSKKGSAITITLNYHKPNYEILLTDQGIGIKKKDLPKIFERFYKGENEKSGMGLGLYLAKQIVQNHRGTISVDSKLHKGTTFKITIPSKTYAW